MVLDHVHPDLVQAITHVLEAMAHAGHPMVVTNGVRTEAQQAALYAQGRTAPGPTVTNCDGVHTKSNHQLKADGFGHAVDCTFTNEKGKPVWKDSYPWSLYGANVRAQHLQWGGDWHHADRPHAELGPGPDQT